MTCLVVSHFTKSCFINVSKQADGDSSVQSVNGTNVTTTSEQDQERDLQNRIQVSY